MIGTIPRKKSGNFVLVFHGTADEILKICQAVFLIHWDDGEPMGLPLEEMSGGGPCCC